MTSPSACPPDPLWNTPLSVPSPPHICQFAPPERLLNLGTYRSAEFKEKNTRWGWLLSCSCRPLLPLILHCVTANQKGMWRPPPPPLSLLYIIFSMPLLAIQCSGNFRTSTGVSCQPSGFSRRSIWLDGALPSGLASLCRPTCLCSSASKPHFVHAPGKQPYPDLNITLNRSSGPFCWRSCDWLTFGKCNWR